MHWTRRNALALLLAGSAMALGCGQEGSSTALLSGVGPRSSEPLPFPWPPTKGEAYPDVTLLDHRGESVQLSSFRGKVLLVELVGMT